MDLLPARRYWAVNLDGVKVAGKGVPALTSRAAILDSGTSLIFAADIDAQTINQVQMAPCLSFQRALNAMLVASTEMASWRSEVSGPTECIKSKSVHLLTKALLIRSDEIRGGCESVTLLNQHPAC